MLATQFLQGFYKRGVWLAGSSGLSITSYSNLEDKKGKKKKKEVYITVHFKYKSVNALFIVQCIYLQYIVNTSLFFNSVAISSQNNCIE